MLCGTVAVRAAHTGFAVIPALILAGNASCVDFQGLDAHELRDAPV